MEDEEPALKPNGVNRTVGIAIVGLNHLEDARTLKPFKRFGPRVLISQLSGVQSVSNVFPNLIGKFL